MTTLQRAAAINLFFVARNMSAAQLFMPFPKPQIKATFLKRPQRFLAQVVLLDGFQTLAYCANPGSLKGCLQSGSAALLWDSQDRERKRRYTLRAVEFNGVWVGTDTHLANRLVEQALLRKVLPQLKGYKILQREWRLNAGLRIDFLLGKAKKLCFVEVKSATIVEKGVARFPDSITPRGLKHLKSLTQQAMKGHRAALVFVIQRNDAHSFMVNGDHYLPYIRAFQKALAAGVEVLALGVRVGPKGFSKPKLLSVHYEHLGV